MQNISLVRRIAKTDDFSSVFAFRKAVRSTSFCLHYRPNDLGSARLGIATPKKFLRRAIDRNTIRRIARESFRALHGCLAAYDGVLRVSRALAAPLDKAALRREIDALLKRVTE